MADPRQYRPGSRHPKFRRYTAGEYTNNRRAWARTFIGEVILMHYPEKEDQKEPGPTVKVLMPQHKARTVTWDLTSLTSEELKALRSLLDLAFDAASSIVANRDKVAQDAFNRGDDSYSRVYRQVPQFIDRSREESEDDQGVHDGHSPVSGGDADGAGPADSSGGVRGAGGGMAHDGSEVDEPEDSGSSED